jgi:hypothetical protein
VPQPLAIVAVAGM